MRHLTPLLLSLVLVGCPKPEAAIEAPVAAVVDTFPARPVPGPPAAFDPAQPVQTTLKNGIQVYTVSDNSLPLVSLRLIVPTGSADDPAGQYGVASLGASMLGEGAGERTALEQAAALNNIATDVAFGVGRETLYLSLDTHKDQLAAALPLAADALLRPRFDKADWSRVQEQHLNGLKAQQDDNSAVARVVAPRQWWGLDHPYGKPADGTLATAEALTLKQVQAWHKANVHAGGVSIVVVGDVQPDAVTALLDKHFGGWAVKELAGRDVPAPVGKAGVVIVDSPGSTQTVISAYLPGQAEAAGAGDRAALDAVTTIMGGSFTSRLNRRLREELGYTYGARMSASRLQGGGVLMSGAAVRGDATADALKELMALLQAAHDGGFSQDEALRGRAQLVTDAVGSAETRSALAGTYAGELASGRAPGALAETMKQIDGLDAAAASQAAKALDPSKALVVLVGDLATIAEPLKAAGFGTWTVVNPDGTPVK